MGNIFVCCVSIDILFYIFVMIHTNDLEDNIDILIISSFYEDYAWQMERRRLNLVGGVELILIGDVNEIANFLVTGICIGVYVT